MTAHRQITQTLYSFQHAPLLKTANFKVDSQVSNALDHRKNQYSSRLYAARVLFRPYFIRICLRSSTGTSPQFFWGDLLTLSEQQYYVWNTASRSTKQQEMQEILGVSMAPLYPPGVRLCSEALDVWVTDHMQHPCSRRFLKV